MGGGCEAWVWTAGSTFSLSETNVILSHQYVLNMEQWTIGHVTNGDNIMGHSGWAACKNALQGVVPLIIEKDPLHEGTTMHVFVQHLFTDPEPTGRRHRTRRGSQGTTFFSTSMQGQGWVRWRVTARRNMKIIPSRALVWGREGETRDD